MLSSRRSDAITRPHSLPRARGLRGTAMLLVVGALLLTVACDDDPDDQPAGSPPAGGQVVTGPAPLHEARLDAAKRAQSDALDVSLTSVRGAGFDGCLGVTAPGEACNQLLLGGFIALFDARGSEYRYHFGGNRFVFADPARQVSDGFPVPPEIAPDLNRELAAYAREDLALRVDRDAEAHVTAIIPLVFPSSCMGFLPEGQSACTDAMVEGAVVFLVGPDAKTYRYHVGSNGAVATDFVKGRITFEPNPAVRVSEQLLRDDLARRLGVNVGLIDIVSYRLVTWPDGCVGVHRPDAICAQALVDGFLALLSGPDGKEYRYHGGVQGSFVAASFETTARIAEPLPRR